MLRPDELATVCALRDGYMVLVCNAHDVHLQSLLTGHEWIIISPYDNSCCQILHRHSPDGSFHHQQGQYRSLSSALDYIRRHDAWFCEKKHHREIQISKKRASRKIC